MSRFKIPIYFFIFILLLCFVFRSLILNIGTNLIDWYDYPFVVWVFSQNIDHLLVLDFKNLFNSNILYPHRFTLLLSENFFVPSLLATPFYVLTRNLILSFNLQFLLTFILNYLSSYLLWRSIFKNTFVAFLGGIITVFSPIFHFELVHFQMQIYWPFLFCLYFLNRSIHSNKTKYTVLTGVFVVVQFLSNLYLSVFLIISIVVYFAVRALFYKNFTTLLKKLVTVLIVFFVLSGPFIIGHIRANKEVGVARSYIESVQYSAHLTDYVFSNNIKSLIHQSFLMKRWNSLNNHPLATFPGFLITLLAILALLNIKIVNKQLLIKLQLDSEKLFYFLLTVIGFVFSLGPRLNVNGLFAGIPLPYDLLVKYIPFFDSLRVTARWSFLLYLGLIYLGLRYLSRYKINSLIYIVLLTFVFLEYIPINLQTQKQNYIREKDHLLQTACSKQKQVVLEIPVSHFDAGTHVAEGLNYISKTQLASTYHKCLLVNGYSSYDLPSLLKLKDDIYQSAMDLDTKKFKQLVDNTGARFVSLNIDDVPASSREKYEKLINEAVASSYIKEVDKTLYTVDILP